jgi:lysophospholipid acyltransferase (LPLAT)-like uncharacterized protein
MVRIVQSYLHNCLRKYLLPSLLTWFYKVWASTWRVSLIEDPLLRADLREGRLVTFAIWHGDELALLRFAHRYRVATMTSTSQDGDLMDTILHKFGFQTSRGSSTRGGSRALVGLLRLGRAGRNPVVAVDGPKGPFHKAKPGIFEISKKLGTPIYPGSVAASNSLVFGRSWNKAFLPLPFSKVALIWGPPLQPPPDGADARDESLALELEAALLAAGQEAAKLVGSKPL